MLSTDRLDLLQLFVRVAETGKISDAANAAGISQPSASRLLKRLESLLDTQLFQRMVGNSTRTRESLSNADAQSGYLFIRCAIPGRAFPSRGCGMPQFQIQTMLQLHTCSAAWSST